MSVKEFTLDLAALHHHGTGLVRPECVLAAPDGTLWTSDASQGGVTRIAADGSQETIGHIGGETNGFALDAAGTFYLANLAHGAVYKLYRDGRHELMLGEIDGHPLGAANFVWRDSQGRLWISVSTRRLPWVQALVDPQPDGYIILLDEHGPRIVADDINFTNEIRLNRDESYLYVAETLGARMLRFPVHADGTLGAREVFGPDPLGETAAVDGFAFDEEENVWVTTVTRNGLMVIAADGEAHVVFEDPNEPALAAMMQAMAGGTMSVDLMLACAGPTLQFPTSVAFGGPERKTVYIGSLAMPHLLTFTAPVAGLPLTHV